MNWQDFIKYLLDHDLRLSSLEVEQLTGIRQQIIDRWKKGLVGKPQRNTIKRFEQGLGIKIDDSDPENITYKRLHEKEYEEIERDLNLYPVIATVHAGISPEYFQSTDEGELEMIAVPYKKKENCFLVRVTGDSMNGIVSEGDMVLADMDAPIVNGNTVIARLKNGKQVIKKYKEIPSGMIMLFSNNENYEPIIIHKSEIEVMFRIVGIWREV